MDKPERYRLRVPAPEVLKTRGFSAPFHSMIQGQFKTFLPVNHSIAWVTGIRGLMRSMANLPQGNQELLVVRDKVGRPPGELWVSKSMECDIFPFSALTLLVGLQEEHPAC